MAKSLNILSPFLLLSLLLLAGCAGTQTPPKPDLRPTQLSQPPGDHAVTVARAMLGTPYRYGGSDTTGFDCSGLVYYAYRQAGVDVPRTSTQQYRATRKVPLSLLQPGDLLFFRLSPPKISHVGIYTGDDQFIHAPSSGKQVCYASLDNDYWRKHLVAAGRVR